MDLSLCCRASVARDDGFAGARLHARGAVVALLRVDDVDLVAFGDRVVRTLIDTGAARQTLFGDLVGHKCESTSCGRGATARPRGVISIVEARPPVSPEAPTPAPAPQEPAPPLRGPPRRRRNA